MRKLILISAFVLASVSAHAGESRSLTAVAANDEPKAVEKVEAVKPEEIKAQEARVQETNAPETTAQEAKVDVKADGKTDVKADSAQPESSKHHASRQARKSHVRGYEGDEAKARRIAARYGVYW